jgi:hypothetical protein
MRKINRLFIVALIFACFSFSATKAQSTVVKLNWLSLPLSIVNVGFEMAISDGGSVMIQPWYWLGGKQGDLKYSGLGANVDYRWYPSGTAPKGFFLAPGFRYMSLNMTDENWININTGATSEAKGSLTGIGGGLCLGGQFIFGDVVTLDLYGGPGYMSYNAKWDDSNYSGSEPLVSGFWFRFGSTIGIAF